MAMWQRHHLAALMLDSLAAQAERLKERLALSVVVAGSEGAASRKVAESRGAHYVHIENNPLGRKWQAALKKARTLAPTGVMVLGSDNIVNDALLRGRAALLELGYEYIGCLDAYQWNPHRRTLIHWNGYAKPRDASKPDREGEPIGSSRTFAATLLDRMSWSIWDEGANRCLDFSTTQRLKEHTFKKQMLRMKGTDARHLGIKVSGAMSPSLHTAVKGRLDENLLVEWFGPAIGGRILAL
jgi:hypothetical protein